MAYPEVMAAKDKIYRVPTEGSAPAKAVVAPNAANPLPLALAKGRAVQVGFTVSDDLKKWGKVKRVHEVILRVRLQETTERDRWRFVFNGRDLPEKSLRRINQMYVMDAPRYRVFGYWFVFRLDESLWPVRGRNMIEVQLLKRDGQALPAARLSDVELEIRYLLGKNFHRGLIDGDLALG